MDPRISIPCPSRVNVCCKYCIFFDLDTKYFLQQFGASFIIDYRTFCTFPCFPLETSTLRYSSVVNVLCCTNALDVPSQDPSSPRGSPAHSPRENGLDKTRLLKKDAPISPASIASSSSTPSSKSKELSLVSCSSSSFLALPVSS